MHVTIHSRPGSPPTVTYHIAPYVPFAVILLLLVSPAATHAQEAANAAAGDTVEAFEISTMNTSELPPGKEADGIVQRISGRGLPLEVEYKDHLTLQTWPIS